MADRSPTRHEQRSETNPHATIANAKVGRVPVSKATLMNASERRNLPQLSKTNDAINHIFDDENVDDNEDHRARLSDSLTSLFGESEADVEVVSTSLIPLIVLDSPQPPNNSQLHSASSLAPPSIIVTSPPSPNIFRGLFTPSSSPFSSPAPARQRQFLSHVEVPPFPKGRSAKDYSRTSLKRPRSPPMATAKRPRTPTSADSTPTPTDAPNMRDVLQAALQNNGAFISLSEQQKQQKQWLQPGKHKSISPFVSPPIPSSSQVREPVKKKARRQEQKPVQDSFHEQTDVRSGHTLARRREFSSVRYDQEKDEVKLIINGLPREHSEVTMHNIRFLQNRAKKDKKARVEDQGGTASNYDVRDSDVQGIGKSWEPPMNDSLACQEGLLTAGYRIPFEEEDVYDDEDDGDDHRHDVESEEEIHAWERGPQSSEHIRSINTISQVARTVTPALYPRSIRDGEPWSTRPDSKSSTERPKPRPLVRKPSNLDNYTQHRPPLSHNNERHCHQQSAQEALGKQGPSITAESRHIQTTNGNVSLPSPTPAPPMDGKAPFTAPTSAMNEHVSFSPSSLFPAEKTLQILSNTNLRHNHTSHPLKSTDPPPSPARVVPSMGASQNDDTVAQSSRKPINHSPLAPFGSDELFNNIMRAVRQSELPPHLQNEAHLSAIVSNVLKGIYPGALTVPSMNGLSAVDAPSLSATYLPSPPVINERPSTQVSSDIFSDDEIADTHFSADARESQEFESNGTIDPSLIMGNFAVEDTIRDRPQSARSSLSPSPLSPITTSQPSARYSSRDRSSSISSSSSSSAPLSSRPLSIVDNTPASSLQPASTLDRAPSPSPRLSRSAPNVKDYIVLDNSEDETWTLSTRKQPRKRKKANARKWYGEEDLDFDDHELEQPAKKPEKKRSDKGLVPQGGDWLQEEERTYCHQCRRCTNYLKLVCACSKRYCIRCIRLRYTDEIAINLSDGSEFTCPFCQNCCTCDYCTRKRGEVYVSLKGKRRNPTTIPKEMAPKKTSPRPLPIDTTPGRVQYWATMYTLDDAQIAGVFTSTGSHTGDVVTQPLRQHRTHEDTAKKRQHIYVGDVQESWNLSDRCLVKELNPVSWRDRSNGPNERIYVGDKRVLFIPMNRGRQAGNRVNLTSIYDEIGSLSSLSSLEEDDESSDKAGEGELCQGSAHYVAETDFEMAVQGGFDDLLTKSQKSEYLEGSLTEVDVARAIGLGLRACGIELFYSY